MEPVALSHSRRRLLRGAFALAGVGLVSGCGSAPFLSTRPARVPRVGLLHNALESLIGYRVEAFRQGLRDLGYVEGESLVIEYRWGELQEARLRELAADLVRLPVDVLVTGGPLATRVAREATPELPIVMTMDPDPVSSGFVVNLARPGGNITGLVSLAPAMNRKSLELLTEILPAISRIAVLGNSVLPGNDKARRELEDAAKTLQIQVRYLEVRQPPDIEPAVTAAVDGQAEALFVQTGPAIIPHGQKIAALAARERLVLMGFAEEGGLISYGVNLAALDYRAAYYVDRILKGTRPADLPVEQPTAIDLAINLKTAEALGLTLPQSVLVQATKILQ